MVAVVINLEEGHFELHAVNTCLIMTMVARRLASYPGHATSDTWPGYEATRRLDDFVDMHESHDRLLH